MVEGPGERANLQLLMLWIIFLHNCAFGTPWEGFEFQQERWPSQNFIKHGTRKKISGGTGYFGAVVVTGNDVVGLSPWLSR